jgi:hypothetical protein
LEVVCSEDQTPEGPEVVYQTVYFEDVSIPSWIVNPTVGHVLWGTVKGFAKCFRDFQTVYDTLPAAGGGGGGDTLAARVQSQQAERAAEEQERRRRRERRHALASHGACVVLGMLLEAGRRSYAAKRRDRWRV